MKTLIPKPCRITEINTSENLWQREPLATRVTGCYLVSENSCIKNVALILLSWGRGHNAPSTPISVDPGWRWGHEWSNNLYCELLRAELQIGYMRNRSTGDKPSRHKDNQPRRLSFQGSRPRPARANHGPQDKMMNW